MRFFTIRPLPGNRDLCQRRKTRRYPQGVAAFLDRDLPKETYNGAAAAAAQSGRGVLAARSPRHTGCVAAITRSRIGPGRHAPSSATFAKNGSCLNSSPRMPECNLTIYREADTGDWEMTEIGDRHRPPIAHIAPQLWAAARRSRFRHQQNIWEPGPIGEVIGRTPTSRKRMAITNAQRERAARALCRKAGYPEDAIFEGQPAWAWYLDQVDTVLETTLSTEDLARLRGPDRKNQSAN